MVKILSRLILLFVPLLFLSCEERLHQTDSGGVILEVDFPGTIPWRASVNGATVISAETLNITNVVADPEGTFSALMDVELESVEVTYERVDGGTLVPPPYIHKLSSIVPANGSTAINNMPLLSFDQLSVPPLSDLLFENGGFNKETGLTYVRMNLLIRVFGRTVSDRAVSSVPRPLTMEFTQ